MLVKRVAIENVRSFLDRAELMLDGEITIVIGPNGGGKTNLLDTIIVILRRYLFASMYAVLVPGQEQLNRYQFQYNDALNTMILEPHSAGKSLPQKVEIEVEVTSKDTQNMHVMKTDATRLTELASKKYINLNLLQSSSWELDEIIAGKRFVYRLLNGSLQQEETAATSFLQYLQMFEMESMLREEFEFAPLSTPLIYLPVNRAASGFQSSVELANYNDYEVKRHSDTANSRSPTSILNLAVGRLAQKFRLLLEEDKGIAAQKFYEDLNLKELTKLLCDLGYEWSLETINPLKNQYNIQLTKQGTSFLASRLSLTISG